MPPSEHVDCAGPVPVLSLGYPGHQVQTRRRKRGVRAGSERRDVALFELRTLCRGVRSCRQVDCARTCGGCARHPARSRVRRDVSPNASSATHSHRRELSTGDCPMADTPTFGRYAEIPYDQMTPEQQDAYRWLIETRGRLPGPNKIYVHNPKLAKLMGPLGAHFRTGYSLSEREREIAVNVIL